MPAISAIDHAPDNAIAASSVTTLHAPSLSLCGCIRAYVTRSTMAGPLLSEAQRMNLYPAAPICTFAWYLHGEATLLRIGETALEQPLPVPVVFNGPRADPLVSINPGRVDMFMLVLLPEALHLLTGIDLAAHTNRSSSFDSVFDAGWQAMAQAVLQASDHATRIALLEAFFAPRWQAVRSQNGRQAQGLRDYVHGMAVQAMASGWRRSARQLERRVKTWSGMSLQRLFGLRRAEHRFIAARELVREGGASWAEIAADTGYADQAHFCRETRKVTGLTPKELKLRVMQQESYWVYRIWS